MTVQQSFLAVKIPATKFNDRWPTIILNALQLRWIFFNTFNYYVGKISSTMRASGFWKYLIFAITSSHENYST